MNMKIIVGLGNPGEKYHNTKHNIGFDLIDHIAAARGISLSTQRHKAVYGKGVIGGVQVLLVKPQTFMNLSGECLLALATMYKVPPENFMVIYDDYHLNLGAIRIRKNGSAGGHNGIKSIIASIGENFIRLRIGIGAPDREAIDHVLSKFSKEDYQYLAELFPKLNDCVADIIGQGVESAMNKYTSQGRKV